MIPDEFLWVYGLSDDREVDISLGDNVAHFFFVRGIEFALFRWRRELAPARGLECNLPPCNTIKPLMPDEIPANRGVLFETVVRA